MRSVDKKLIAITGAGAFALGALSLWPLARAPDPVPVQVGGNGQLDACGATGTALSAGVVVRAGPGDEYPAIDELVAGLPLAVCGDASGTDRSAWRAIVYPPLEEPAIDCGVATPRANATRYAGPCRSGWVRAETIMAVAG